MAFITIEDLYGTVEVIVFPRDYEKNVALIMEDAKVFVAGRASVEEDKDGKIICEKITAFEDTKKKMWIKFTAMSEYEDKSTQLYDILKKTSGKDAVAIYIEEGKKIKNLPASQGVSATTELISTLKEAFGEENIQVTEAGL
jgi:DNA polymerase-3 subunit alpha